MYMYINQWQLHAAYEQIQQLLIQHTHKHHMHILCDYSSNHMEKYAKQTFDFPIRRQTDMYCVFVTSL